MPRPSHLTTNGPSPGEEGEDMFRREDAPGRGKDVGGMHLEAEAEEARGPPVPSENSWSDSTFEHRSPESRRR